MGGLSPANSERNRATRYCASSNNLASFARSSSRTRNRFSDRSTNFRDCSNWTPTGTPCAAALAFSESSGAHGTPARNPLPTLREPVPTSELSLLSGRKTCGLVATGLSWGSCSRGLECANDHVELLRGCHTFASPFLLVRPLNGRRSRPPNDLVPTVGNWQRTILFAAYNYNHDLQRRKRQTKETSWT